MYIHWWEYKDESQPSSSKENVSLSLNQQEPLPVKSALKSTSEEICHQNNQPSADAKSFKRNGITAKMEEALRRIEKQEQSRGSTVTIQIEEDDEEKRSGIIEKPASERLEDGAWKSYRSVTKNALCL